MKLVSTLKNECRELIMENNKLKEENKGLEEECKDKEKAKQKEKEEQDRVKQLQAGT